MRYSRQPGHALDHRFDVAASDKDPFTGFEKRIKDWVLTRIGGTGLRPRQMPWPEPLRDTWAEESGHRHAPLPPMQTVLNRLRSEFSWYKGAHDEKFDEKLLGIMLGRTIAKMDPPADLLYARRQVDPKGLLPAASLRKFVARDGYAIYSGETRIGKAGMQFVDANNRDEREAWLTSLEFSSGHGSAEDYLSAHLTAAALVHIDDYALRTPETPFDIHTHDAWQHCLGAAGVATLVEPFVAVSEIDRLYTGHAAIAPHPLSPQAAAATFDRRIVRELVKAGAE